MMKNSKKTLLATLLLTVMMTMAGCDNDRTDTGEITSDDLKEQIRQEMAARTKIAEDQLSTEDRIKQERKSK